MPYIHPQTWDDGVMPLSEFPQEKQAEIARLVALPRPPKRWMTLSGGLARIETRAWHEWHWARGRKLKYVPPPAGERRPLPKKIRAQVIGRDGLVCGICKDTVEPGDVHIDHIHPVALGGTNALENLQVAHSRCNIRKGARV